MDGLPPPPPLPPPALVAPAPASAGAAALPPTSSFAASDVRPRDDRERALCARAARPDWLYLGVLVAADVGTVYLDAFQLKYAGNSDDANYRSLAPVRMIGPATIGLAWGATLGGGFLSVPRCSVDWVGAPPPEGEVRTPWPTALAVAALAGATAPVLVGIETGPLPILWSTEERATRLVVAGVTGFAGALIPYVLPPSTWRAARELEHVRAGVGANGGFVSYTLRF